MHLYRGINYTLMRQADSDELAWLKDYLTLPPAKHANFPIRLYHYGSLDEDHKGLLFGAGLTVSVVKAAQRDGIDVSVHDFRNAPPPTDLNADRAWLRDYQQKAVNAALIAKNGLLWLPTGAGKTEIAIGLVNSVRCQWLFLVHRGVLADQAAERYHLRTGRHAATIKNGKWVCPHGNTRLTVTTFQTLWRHRKKPEIKFLLDSIQGVIVDEAHVSAAKTFYKTIMRLKNAYYRIGLSGTPLQRTDNKAPFVVGALGPPIFKLEANELIGKGVVAKPHINMVVVRQPPAIRPCEYADVYKSHVVNSDIRNSVILNIAKNAPKPTLLFTRSVAHAHKLNDMLNAIGVYSDVVTGKDWDDSRARKIKRLNKGLTDAIVCTVVFQEGVDIPELKSVIIGSGGASAIATLQRIGRGMRVTDSKQSCLVWDIFDRGERWLENQSRKRKKTYVKAGHTVTVQALDCVIDK